MIVQRPRSAAGPVCIVHGRQSEVGNESGCVSCTPGKNPTLGMVSGLHLYPNPGMWLALLNMCASHVEFKRGSGSIEGWVAHTVAGNGGTWDVDIEPGVASEPHEPPTNERRSEVVIATELRTSAPAVYLAADLHGGEHRLGGGLSDR